MNYGTAHTQRYYEFELDSLSASSTATGDNTVENWPLFRIGGKSPLKNIASVKVLEAQIPFSYYVFNSTNNTFILNESAPVAPHLVTIPEGNYTITEFVAALKLALDTSGGAGVYTVTYSSVTMKLTISTTQVFNFDFGTNTYTSPHQEMGFSIGVSQSGAGNILTSFAIMVTGPNYLYVNSTRLGSLIELYLPASGNSTVRSGNDGPQIAKIPVTAQPGGVMYWQDPDPMKWFNLENLASLSEIDFYLTLGSNPRPIDFNGQGFSLKIGVIENAASTQDFQHNGDEKILKRFRAL